MLILNKSWHHLLIVSLFSNFKLQKQKLNSCKRMIAINHCPLLLIRWAQGGSIPLIANLPTGRLHWWHTICPIIIITKKGVIMTDNLQFVHNMWITKFALANIGQINFPKN